MVAEIYRANGIQVRARVLSALAGRRVSCGVCGHVMPVEQVQQQDDGLDEEIEGD